MLSRSRVCAAVVAVVFAATSTAACTGGDAGPDEQASTPSAPDPLEAAWTSSFPDPASLTDGTVQPLGDDRVLYADRGSLVAYDIDSGRRAWSRHIPEACAAGESNAAGDIVLTSGAECRDVAVIDGATGKRRWRRHIPTVSPRYDAGNVTASIGDKTVTVVQFCGQVTRLSLRDGHRLGVLAPHDRACANEADSDGQLIAVWHDPETPATPDDYGTGLIPPHDGTAAFELYDADTGKRLWRRKTDRQTGGLTAGAVVSADPVIVALRENNHMTMRRYSRASGAAEQGGYVGRQLYWLDGAFEPLGVAGGVLVGSYGTSNLDSDVSRIFAYDLESGEELWSRDTRSDVLDGPRAVGVDRYGVVFAQISSDDSDGGSAYGTWVTRWDLRTGEDAGAAAWLDHGELPPNDWAVAGGLFFVLGDDITAYELPEENADLTPPDSSNDWAPDDVRNDPLTDPCTAVSPTTLRTVGMHRSVGLPVPANCTWIEHDQPYNSDRGLRVEVTIAEPGPLQELNLPGEDRTAVQNAKAIMRSTRFAPGVVPGAALPAPMPDPKPLDDFGDEAYATSGAVFAASTGSAAGSYVRVRVRNVIVDVEADGGYVVADETSAPASLRRSETGVIGAAREVLDSLGLSVGVPDAPPDDGRFDRAKGVCSVLRDDAATLGLREVRNLSAPASDPRTAECAWRDEQGLAELTLHAYAAAGSPLTGRTGREVAQSVLEASSDQAKATDGLGDRATVSGSDPADGYSSREIVVRADNLVLELSYSQGDPRLGEQVEADAMRMTREILRAGVRVS